MTIYEYLKITPEQYTFKRDYIQNPLKKNVIRKNGGLEYEQPYLEDVKYLYITLNKSVREMNQIMGYKIQDKLSKWFNKREYMKTPKLSKEELYNKLYVEKIPMIQLAKSFGYIGTQPIQDWCKIYGIELKSPRYVENKFNKDDLYNDYIKNSLTIRNICKKYKSEKSSIHKALKMFGLISSEYNEERLMYMRIKRNKNYEIIYNKEKLINYIKENGNTSQAKIANSLSIPSNIVRNFIKKYDLENMFSYIHSSYEEEINKIFPNMFIMNNRKELYPYEIDLYNEDKKIGIEFNGNYWHSNKIKNKLYHQNKSLLAESKGIFLYHIFEYEWINNKERIINQLNNLLNNNKEKIYARCCEIKEVDNKEKSQFLELNHMQGNDVSSIKIGLYYNDELVSLMTFVKPRFNKNYQYELSRFCSKAGCNVIGGASKLWKYFITNYKPESVISYSNIAHTKGNLYGMLGFKLHNISKPNYVWCKDLDVLSRYQCQKHKLLEQGYIGDSEVDIMHNRGYHRIYDCGNKVWVWNNI